MPFIRKLSHSPKHHAHKHQKFSDNKWQKYYGTKEWHNLRQTKLYDQPLCERCLAYDRVRPATEVHHHRVFGSFPTEEERWYWFLNYDNLISLCHECHQYIHQHGDSEFIERYD